MTFITLMLPMHHKPQQSESNATTCYFFLHTTKADVLQVDMNVCLRVCGYGILIVNIAQLWIITATREAIMDYSALMAFGGAEVVVGISMSCLYLTVICAIWRARVGIDSGFQMRAHINGKHQVIQVPISWNLTQSPVIMTIMTYHLLPPALSFNISPFPTYCTCLDYRQSLHCTHASSDFIGNTVIFLWIVSRRSKNPGQN